MVESFSTTIENEMKVYDIKHSDKTMSKLEKKISQEKRLKAHDVCVKVVATDDSEVIKVYSMIDDDRRKKDALESIIYKYEVIEKQRIDVGELLFKRPDRKILKKMLKVYNKGKNPLEGKMKMVDESLVFSFKGTEEDAAEYEDDSGEMSLKKYFTKLITKKYQSQFSFRKMNPTGVVKGL